MKKILLVTFLLTSLLISAEINIEIEGSNILITGDFEIKQIEEISSLDSVFTKISIKDCKETGTLGGPELAIFSKLLSLPDVGNFIIDDFSCEYEEIEINAPVFPHFYEDDQRINAAIYENLEWYPQENINIGKPVIMRDYRFSQLAIYPLQYNYQTGNLRLMKNMKLKLILDPSDATNPKMHNRGIHTKVFDNIAKNNLINTPQFRSNQQGCYLFIASDEIASGLDFLAQWKNKLGYITKVAPLSETGSSKYAIKNYIQNAYDNWEVPPDYVVLVGDVTGSITVPTFTIEGYLTPWDVTDHIYTMLEGDDYFPDVMLGRISVRSEMEMQVVISKILNYESNPYTDINWFQRALMITYVGDYYTGFYSPRETKNAVRDKLLDFTYTEVDTFYCPYQSGTSQLSSLIDTGVSLVNYRGSGSPYYWWAGYSPLFISGDIYNLNNGFMLPMITSMTCGGGDFGSTNYPSCFGECWVKAGSPTTAKGAIGFIGPSEHDTKTPFNNANDMGIYQGITQENITRCSEMLLRGKMELYNNYPDYHSMDGYNDAWDSDMFYFHVYNLLGDPGLSVWTDQPKTIYCNVNNQFSASVTAIETTVYNENPEGFTVALTNSDSLITTAWTDDNGIANLYCDLIPGDYQITFSKIGFIPSTYDIVITDPTGFYLIDEELNQDLESASTSTLSCTLANCYDNQISLTNAELSCEDSELYVIENPNVFPIDLVNGESNTLYFNITTTTQWQNETESEFILAIESTEGIDSLYIPLTMYSPELIVNNPSFSNLEQNLIQGETVEANPILQNMGDRGSGSINLQLTCESPWIEISESLIAYENIEPNMLGQGSSTFSLSIDDEAPTGEMITLNFNVIKSEEIVYSFSYSHPLGVISPELPTTDNYGYKAIESEDDTIYNPPLYEWREIDPYYGGVGSIISGSNTSPDGFTANVELPFTFKYYGTDYDTISVCKHGWIAMGDTDLMFFRNRNIPSGVGAPAMIAPFWDQILGGYVFEWYDENNNWYVIEWSRFQNACSYDNEAFQILLFDPQHYPTPTGDGAIMFQYRNVSNSDYEEQYCTVGIENATQTDGLLLNFNHTPVPTAHPLEPATAILITTGDSLITSADNSEALPSIQLHQNIPNPFNPKTHINFTSSIPNGSAELEIYNIKGQLIRILKKDRIKTGLNTFIWDGKNNQSSQAGSGIYLYQLRVDGNIVGKEKMVLIK